MSAFIPGGTNVAITMNTSNAEAALTAGQAYARVVNPTTDTIFVKFDDASSLTADATDDIPVQGGSDLIVKIGSKVNRVAVIGESGASGGAVYIQPGNLVA